MELRQVEPFGIEVAGDVGSGFSSAEQDDLREAWASQGLLLFRGIHLSMQEQIDLCGIFGPTLPLGHPENYLVSNVAPDGFLGTQELLFHNDIPFVPAPYPGGSLHAIDVDSGVSATRFASGYLAYDSLPDSLRERIAGLRSLQLRKRVAVTRTRLTDLVDGDSAAVHSVVRRHRTTGRPYVFVNEDMTGGLIGLTEEASDSLLAQIFEVFYSPENVYEHVWRNGDMVLWDNLAVQHARAALTTPAHRTLQRVTVAKYGLYDQNPTDLENFERLKSVNRGAQFEAEPVG